MKAIVIVKGASSALYLHRHGSRVPELLRRAGPSMRRGDPEYAQARLIGAACEMFPGPLNVGLIPSPTTYTTAELNTVSQGGTGLWLIDAQTGAVAQYGSDVGSTRRPEHVAFWEER